MKKGDKLWLEVKQKLLSAAQLSNVLIALSQWAHDRRARARSSAEEVLATELTALIMEMTDDVVPPRDQLGIIDSVLDDFEVEVGRYREKIAELITGRGRDV